MSLLTLSTRETGSSRSKAFKIMNRNDESIPIQYREGNARFMDIEVSVDPRVLIPRPETELLVETVVLACREKGWNSANILEIGTGSGIIPIGIARKLSSAKILSVDVSLDALEVAEANIEKFGLDDRIELKFSDMFGSLGSGYVGSFDIIASNPPYVSSADFEKLDEWVQSEPRIALYAGEEGMDHLRVIADNALEYLKPGGMLAVEVGYDQADKVKHAFRDAGMTGVTSIKDDSDHERVIIGWKNG